MTLHLARAGVFSNVATTPHAGWLAYRDRPGARLDR
jgi:hypothetical protein